MAHRIRSLDEASLDGLRLLILDFDGVVTDLDVDWPVLKDELNRHCRRELGSNLSFESIQRGRARVRAEAGPSALEAVDAILRRAEQEALTRSAPRDGLFRFLESVPIGLAICSSNSRPVIEAALDRFGCRSRFACVVGREDVENPKPAPEGLLAILERLDCPPAAAAFVGDREVDRRAGEAAGVRTFVLDGSEAQRLESIAAETSYAAGFNGYLTRYRARVVRELVPRGGHLLDLGCGEGILTERLLDHFDAVTAVEASAAFLARARERLGTGADCLQSLVEDYRADRTFACILASGLLEHVEDPVGLLRRMAGWLAEAGRIVVIVPNALSLHRRVGVALGLLDFPKQLQAQDFDVGHRRYYDAVDLRRDVEAAGLSVIAEDGVLLKPLSNAQMEAWAPEMVEALFGVGRDLPSWCAELVAVCGRGSPEP